MAKSNTTTMAVAMLVGLIFLGLPCLEAQSPLVAPVMSPGVPMAMAPTMDCTTALYNLTDCLSFVQNGSTMTVPDKNCCPEFAGLLESNPICLCQLIEQAENFQIDINRAFMVPKACKIQVPYSIDLCPASPAPAPSAASDAPGSTAGSPISDGGAPMSPTATENVNGSGISRAAVHDLSTFICLAIAIFIAYYF
ncbi:non-specific lipid transfer protein GPI-anchored 12-like [Rutidosis leptorrhynchoides]|uniref:non-specific lipid transfer protein GPI-anchored 12-like n=1 Tax=Rutidosis leptorrhynchoides TaxID=125765 RepID=UPI003A98D031